MTDDQLRVGEYAMSLAYKVFSGGGVFSTAMGALQDANKQAAAFVNKLPAEAIVSITQSHSQINYAAVTVWYRTGPPPADGASQVAKEPVSAESIAKYLDS